MSANPEAFNFLRQYAYGFVRRNGKDSQKLHDHCVRQLAEWRQGDGAASGLTDAEANQIVGDVTHWTINRYNPPKPKAERSREERAATEMTAPVLLEFAAEVFGAATVRNAARISGQSKTTIARHLRKQGIAPKREKKLQALPPRVKWLAQVLDATFPKDGEGVLMADHVAAAIWDRSVVPLAKTARSTLSTRRKKMPEYLSAINGARIGFHLVIVGDVVAVRRGRRFRGVKDTVVWIDDQRKRRGTRAIVLPSSTMTSQIMFWSDPWLQDVLAILRIGDYPYFTDPGQLEPLLRLTRVLIDPTPLYHLFELVIWNSYRDDFPQDLSALAQRVRKPSIRNAAFKVAADINWLSTHCKYDPHPSDVFNLADHRLNFMARARDVAPNSYARLGYFRAVVLTELSAGVSEQANRLTSVLERCQQLGAQEQRGEWAGPSSADLALYHPDNEPPF